MDRLWTAMQFVERNRHQAEQLEARAATAETTAYGALLAAIAQQRRQIAEQRAALAMGRTIGSVERLPRR